MNITFLQKIDSDYEIVPAFFVYAGIRSVFEKIRIIVDELDFCKISAQRFNAYVEFSTDTQTYPFPLILQDLDSLDGDLAIELPSTLAPGFYNVRLKNHVLRDYTKGFPVLGAALFGSIIFSRYNQQIIDDSTLPLIRSIVKGGVDVPISGPASKDEKEAVIRVLKDWLADTTLLWDQASNAIVPLDADISSSGEIYSAYQDSVIMKNDIPYVTLDNSVYSLKREVEGES